MIDRKTAEKRLTDFFVGLNYGLEKSQELAKQIMDDVGEQVNERWLSWRERQAKKGCLA